VRSVADRIATVLDRSWRENGRGFECGIIKAQRRLDRNWITLLVHSSRRILRYRRCTNDVWRPDSGKAALADFIGLRLSKLMKRRALTPDALVLSLTHLAVVLQSFAPL
jgi:hypothetical protein